MYLAVMEETSVTTQEIARCFEISFHHEAKVTQWLARNGYVKALRGRHGGIKLAVPPQEISIGAVIRATERGMAIVECMKAGPVACKIAPACLLSPIIRDAQEAFFHVLDQKTLADITGNRKHLQQVLNLAMGTDENLYV